jgi:hypothetical protein
MSTLPPVLPISPYLVVVSDPRSCPSYVTLFNSLIPHRSYALACLRGLSCFASHSSDLPLSAPIHVASTKISQPCRRSTTLSLALPRQLSNVSTFFPLHQIQSSPLRHLEHSGRTTHLCSGTFGIYSSYAKGVKLPTNDEHISASGTPSSDLSITLSASVLLPQVPQFSMTLLSRSVVASSLCRDHS